MRLDEYGLEAPPAGLYDFSDQITSGIAGFENVSDHDIALFHQLGFMVVHAAIDSGAIASARAALCATCSCAGIPTISCSRRQLASALVNCPMRSDWTACAR